VPRRSEFLKRALDVAGTLVALTPTLPLMLLLAVAIRLDSGGPVLWRQERIGRHGRPFRILKFRTMHLNADQLLVDYLESSDELRARWHTFQKLPDDPRLTRLGRVLRRWSVDELPQLWNVLLGDMSLVGSRPLLPQQRELYGRAYGDYITVRPGLTGFWQVRGRNRLSFAERAQCDIYYIRHRSLRLDLRILVKTLWTLATRDGAL